MNRIVSSGFVFVFLLGLILWLPNKVEAFNTIVTDNATNILCSGATLNGKVSSTLTGSVRSYFKYGLTPSYSEGWRTESKTIQVTAGANAISFYDTVTDLLPNFSYYCRAVLDDNISLGEDISFTTSFAPSGYSLFTIGSSDVSGTTAILYGSISMPSSSNISCFFQYVSEEKEWRDSSRTSSVSMTNTGSFSSSATSLVSGKRYKFRSVMRLSTGCEIYGSEVDYFICPKTSLNNSYVSMKSKWIYNIYPDGAIVDNWTSVPSSSVSYESLNDDWRSTDDSNYVYTSGEGQTSSFSFTDTGYSLGTTISKIVITVRAKRVDSKDNITLFLSYIGDNGTRESDQRELFFGETIVSDYQNIETSFVANPVTGDAWTMENISNMRWGIRKEGDVSNCYVSQIYVTVYPEKIDGVNILANRANWVSLNINNMINYGYLSSASNSDFYYDKSLSYIPGDIKSYFLVPSLSTGQETSYRLRLGTSPSYDHFNLIGEISFPDNSAYEPGLSNLEISWRGKIDATNPGYIVRKANSYELIVNSSNSVQANVWITDNETIKYTITDNVGLISGYHRYDMKRLGDTLFLDRDGIEIGNLSLNGAISDNNSSVEMGERGTVGYSDLMIMKIGNSEVFNPLPSSKITGSVISDGHGRAGNIVVNKLFEMWTEGVVSENSDNPYGGYGEDDVDGDEGNLPDVVVTPGFIPNLFATGEGDAVSTSTGATHQLPMHNEVIVPAAKALGVTTQWIWMMIMVTLSICVALLVFTWINSPWFAIMALCLCLFVFSFTGVLPAWIGLVTAIVGLASLFFGARSGF